MSSIRRIICYSEANCTTGQIVKISKEESHHLFSVLRKKTDELIEILILKDSTAFLAKVISNTEVRLIKKIKKETKLKLQLVVATIKPTLCELIIEKATELGVSSICFFKAEHSRAGVKNIENKLERFLKIRDHALKQSKSTIITKIEFFGSLQDYYSKYLELHIKSESKLDTDSHTYLLSPESKQSLIKLKKSNKYDDLYLIIGPEGGLSENEVNIAIKHAAVKANLGSTILKTETAAILGSGLLLID